MTYPRFFRLIFLLFSLYLMGDVFYRWDGYKFHSSFPEFLPSVALASIIWSILAMVTAFLIWLPLKAMEKLCVYFGLKIKTEHMVLYLGVFMMLATLSWAGTKFMLTDLKITFQIKLAAIILISCLAILPGWIFRNNAEQWISVIQERITPLIWLFGIIVMLSVPITGFHILGKKTNKTISPIAEKSNMSTSVRENPNILLVTFDALTARKMSVYGYNRPTTPFMEKWAAKASLFSRAKAGSNYTTATTASMMTGKRVWTHRKYQHDIAAKPVRIDAENLTLSLKESGYFNYVFVANVITTAEAVGISDSIDIAPSVTEFAEPASVEGVVEKYLFLLFGNKFSIYNWIGQDDFIFTLLSRKIPQKTLLTEYPPEKAFNKFLEITDKKIQEPFFAWIHVLPPHDPVLPPRPFAGTFNQSGELREKRMQYSVRPEIKKYADNDLPYPPETQRRVNILRDYYDEFILYCDKQFEDFVEEIKTRSWANNTVIILSSDHGDSYEHSYYLHNGPHLYEQVTHIPLIVKEPGQTEGRIINDLVEQVDIPATILDLANITVPSWMEGRSFLPLMHGKIMPAKTAISVNLFKNVTANPITKGSIALWEDDYKLIHFLDNGKSLLFNLKKDSDELNNLFDKEPVTGQRLLSLVRDYLNEANTSIMTDRQ